MSANVSSARRAKLDRRGVIRAAIKNSNNRQRLPKFGGPNNGRPKIELLNRTGSGLNSLTPMSKLPPLKKQRRGSRSKV